MEYFQKNNITNKSKFVFIHQNSPHDPYLVNENCQPHFPYSDIYEGYKASYRCVLQEVLDFMTYISINDPKETREYLCSYNKCISLEEILEYNPDLNKNGIEITIKLIRI